jgi:hypothetical protein
MSTTAVEAIEHADWFARYALDRIPEDPDAHPGIQGHLTAARVQLEAALKLARNQPPATAGRVNAAIDLPQLPNRIAA